MEAVCPGGLDVAEGPLRVRACFDVGEGCYLRRLTRLLQFGRPPGPSDPTWTLEDVCLRSTRAHSFLGRPVVIAYHLGTLPVKGGHWSMKTRLRPDRQTFRIISVLRDGEQERIPWDEAAVVGLTPRGVLYVMKEEYARAVISLKLKAARDPSLGYDGPVPAIQPSGEESSTSSSSSGADSQDEGGENAKKKKKKNKKRKRKKKKRSARERDRVEAASHCNCQSCLDWRKYQPNMSPIGPQCLYKINFDVFFYLKLFKLDTAHNREALQECIKLSCCAMDIESVTVNLSKDKKRPPPSCPVPDASPQSSAARRPNRIESSSSSSSSSSEDLTSSESEEGGPVREAAAPFERISKTARADPQGEEWCCLQRPLVIGSMDNTNPGQPDYFRVRGGLEGVQEAVDSYVRHLMELQQRTSARKTVLLAELLEFCQTYRAAHVDFFSVKQVEDKVAVGVWERTLLGLFEKELKRLIKNLYIFSFNGSGEGEKNA